MTMSVIYPPKLLLKRIKKWGNMNDPDHARLYCAVQYACDMDVKMIVLDDEEAILLARMYIEYGKEDDA